MTQSDQTRSVVVPAPAIHDAADQATSDEISQGARSLQQTLSEAVDRAKPEIETPRDDDAPAANSATADPPFWKLNARRGIKIAAALALVAIFGARPLQNLLQASSVEAVLNGRVVTLRAPIDGDVIAAPKDFNAWSAIKGAPVLHIHNANADRTRLDELRRQIGLLDDERPAISARLERARETLRKLEEQTGAFKEGRIRQLENRVAALESDATGTTARAEEAKAAYDRFETLTARGVATVADLTRYNRDNLAASAAERAAKQRVQEARVELDAAREGSFLGDSYNDRPSSAQRADEVRLRIDDIVSDLDARSAQRARYAAELANETERFNLLTDAEVALPVSGRVWEILVSSGERVRRDQDMIRVLDCSTAVVTANVEETVYNQLRIGMPARFRPAEGGDDISGAIISLTGMTGVSGNLAIQPQGLQKQTYHVTVSVPAIAEDGGCGIGRTGRVIFDKSDATSPPPLDFGLRR